MKLTIHTATYNRAYILPQAYESLKAQTCKDFEWIITDDGSTDGTDALVRSWQMADNGFPIIYNPMPHVGLPRAINSGVEKASGAWFMRLDSDDWLVPHAVKKVLGWIAEIESDKSFVGVGFARCQPDGSFMKPQTPLIDPKVGYVDADNIERAKYNLDMDMCEAERTSLLRKFPHQCWPGESFAPEQLNHNSIALAGYKYRWRAEKLYICDYLKDGLTQSDTIVKRNPMGYAMMHNQNMLLTGSFREKLRCAMQMTALSLYAGNPSYLKESNCMTATVLSFPLGFALSIRRRMQYKKL